MAKEDTSEKKQADQKQKHADPPLSEWIVAALGLLLVSGAIGFLVYKAIKEENSPPNLSVSVESISPAEKGFLVKFRIKNAGDQTAADVKIEGELKSGEQTIEKSEMTVTYSPSHSEREGGLFFTKDPQQYQLELRPKGYEKP